MRRIMIVALCLASSALASCTASNPWFGASAHRGGYLDAIAAADLHVSSGRPPSEAVELDL